MNINLAALLSGALYRSGGMAGSNTKARDWGCALILGWYIFRLPITFEWWWHGLAFVALWGALSTYWDSIPFNKKKDNFYLHGFMCGMSSIFYAIQINTPKFWIFLFIRSIVLGLLMGGLNKFVNKYNVPFRDWIEEIFRGVVLIYTIKILFNSFTIL